MTYIELYHECIVGFVSGKDGNVKIFIVCKKLLVIEVGHHN